MPGCVASPWTSTRFPSSPPRSFPGRPGHVAHRDSRAIVPPGRSECASIGQDPGTCGPCASAVLNWHSVILPTTRKARHGMPTITSTDGTEIFYKDWGSGQPIVFSHGWPLSADDWDAQMIYFLGHGYP